MSDNLKRYCDILAALRRLCRTEPTGNHARHLRTFALFISGIVGSRKCQLGAVASKAGAGSLRESRIKRLTRFVQNERITPDVYFVPYLDALLSSLPDQPLVLVMDASTVGRGCLALVVSVLYQKRALLIGWTVVVGEKGHLSDEKHQALPATVAKRLPQGRNILFLGDGEFDGTGLLSALAAHGWQFVCRTAKNAIVWEGEDNVRLSWLNVEAGELIELDNVFVTQDGFGPLLCVACRQVGYDRPLYLLSNLELGEEAVYWYKKRFQIETFFSDQKSRGFGIDKSHLSDPDRLARLLMASCLAYIWLVCLGARIARTGQMRLIHRKSRCDLSLFQIGLLWLEHCQNERIPLHICFRLPSESRRQKSVR
jgi:hypothetical protein